MSACATTADARRSCAAAFVDGVGQGRNAFRRRRTRRYRMRCRPERGASGLGRRSAPAPAHRRRSETATTRTPWPPESTASASMRPMTALPGSRNACDAVLLVAPRLGFALALGERAAGALDVRARPGMAAIEEEHAAPHLDRVLELAREVPIEPGEQQLLDARVVRRRGGLMLGSRHGSMQVAHGCTLATEAASVSAETTCGPMRACGRLWAGWRARASAFPAESARARRGCGYAEPRHDATPRVHAQHQRGPACGGRRRAGRHGRGRSMACVCSIARADPSHHRSVLTFAGEPATARTRRPGAGSSGRRARRPPPARRHSPTRRRARCRPVRSLARGDDGRRGRGRASGRGATGGGARAAGLPLSGSGVTRRSCNAWSGFAPAASRVSPPHGRGSWPPDFGPPLPHPTAGVTRRRRARPARRLEPQSRDRRRRRGAGDCARDSREQRRLPRVKALGLALAHRGLAQVSMNLTDYPHDADARGLRARRRCGAAPRDVASSKAKSSAWSRATRSKRRGRTRPQLWEWHAHQVLEDRLANAGL